MAKLIPNSEPDPIPEELYDELEESDLSLIDTEIVYNPDENDHGILDNDKGSNYY